MDPRIADYIAKNQGKYTREAIRDQLVRAGHSQEAVDRTWDSLAASESHSTDPGWRPGWREYLVLVGIGAVGAFLVWREEPYGGGGVLAAIIYLILASVAFAIGKGLSMAVDRGKTTAVAAGVGIGVGGVAFLLLGSSSLLMAVVVVAVAIGIAGALIGLRATNSRAAGLLGAAIPIIAWLAVTGTCYAPLIGRWTGGQP
jgi:hypothetical protein